MAGPMPLAGDELPAIRQRDRECDCVFPCHQTEKDRRYLLKLIDALLVIAATAANG